jgi:membrane protein
MSKRIQNYLQNILHRPAEYQRRLDRFVRFQIAYWPMVSRRLWRHNPMQMSAALSYQTIFAMIPVLVLTVIFLKAFGVVDDSKQSLQDLLKNAGISQIAVMDESAATQPITSTQAVEIRQVNLGEKIEEIFENVESKITLGSLGPVTILLLIWTALTLLTTMEQSLNHIFGASTNRPLAKRMMMYWSAMTLSPLLFLVGMYLSRSALQASQEVFGLPWVALKFIEWAGPVMIGVLLMATLYKYLPNTAVSKRTAVLGAMVSAPLWLVAKWGFGLYVKHAATNSIYGAAGVIPVFLFWLYISWLIFLLGAEIAYTAANLGRLRLAEEDENIALGPADLLAGAIVVARAFWSSKAPVTIEEISTHIQLSDFTLRRLLDRLARAGIVAEVVRDDQPAAYTLARPAERITILDILELKPSHEERTIPEHYDAEIWSTVEKVTAQVRSATGELTLADIVGRK